MWKQSVWTSLIAAKLASLHLKDGGLVALTGAKAALEGTPGIISIHLGFFRHDVYVLIIIKAEKIIFFSLFEIISLRVFFSAIPKKNFHYFSSL